MAIRPKPLSLDESIAKINYEIAQESLHLQSENDDYLLNNDLLSKKSEDEWAEEVVDYSNSPEKK